jgi:Flp pilus assembly protein TadG
MACPRDATRSARRRGAVAAELALILPLLVLLVLGTVDFGRFAYTYIAVTNAARAGAGYAIMNPYNINNAAATSAWQSAVLQAARDELSNQVGSGNATNLTISPVPTVTRDANGLNRVKITTQYPFTTIINWQWTGLGLPHTLTVSSVIEMRMIR